jgi:hypothetical protein
MHAPDQRGLAKLHVLGLPGHGHVELGDSLDVPWFGGPDSHIGMHLPLLGIDAYRSLRRS